MQSATNVNRKMLAYVRQWLRSVRIQWPYYLIVVATMLLCHHFWAMDPKDHGKVMRAIEVAHASGDFASTEDYVKAWLPRVGRVEFFICLALLFTGPLLTGRESGVRWKSTGQSGRWLWIVTGVMIVSSAVLNSPRLTHSFWNDEEWSARRLIVGDFHSTEKSRHPSWSRTLFYYIDPNNHPMFSALARLSNSLVPVPQGEDEFAFREWPIRLPGFLFGLGGLAAVAWLAMLMGAPRAGMIAVVWLALHPWHVRYGVDARGYALLFTLLPLSMALLWRAVATGGMNGWLAYGLVEFMVLWTYPGALYFVMILNVVACGLLATGPVPEGLSRGLQWRRFAVANLIGAMLTFLMLAPCIQPMVIFLKGGRLRGDVAWGWVMDTLSGLLTGIPWEKWEDHQLALAWMRNGDKDLWRTVLPVAVILLAFLTGVGAMWSQGRGKRWLLALLVLVGPFMFFMARSAGNILYPWYLVVCLPGVAILIGVGVDAVATRWCSERYRWVLPVYFLTLFGAMTWRQNQVLRNHPIEPMRESVAATRMERNALTAQLPGKVLTASVCYPARLYDPAAVHLASVADLRTLMSQADAQKLPLYVNFGDQDFLKLRDPALLALLEDRSQFQALPPFLGIHNQHERRVYCYLGKGKPGG